MPEDSSRHSTRVAQADRAAFAATALLLALLLLIAFPVRAETRVLLLDGSERALELSPYLALQRTPAGSAERLPAEAGFQPLRQRGGLNLGYTPDNIWLRLEVQSTAAQPEEWRIAFSYPPLDRIELFSFGPDGLQRQSAGDSLPLAQRSLDHRSPLFALHLAPGERRILYLRASSSGSLSLEARLWSVAAFAVADQHASLLLALYFGTLLGLTGYNLLLFLALRERSFLLYVLFAASGSLAMLAMTGLGAQYLWPLGGAWGTRALPFFLALANLGAILFSRCFLDSASHVPRWHRLLNLALGVQLAVSLATLVLPATLMLQIIALGSQVNILLLLGCGLACVQRGVPAARTFVVAGLMLLGGSLLLTLRNVGVAASNEFTLGALLLGSALEMLLLSFGLAQRLSALRQRQAAATLSAQRHSLHVLQEQERILEQRVTERTEALAQANARLRELALHDPLTGLANRMAMCQHLEQAWQRARRRQEMLALILLDLDGFKPINDCHGHAAGDQLLVQVARRLQASARSTDLVARLGGDEFVLVCEGIGSEHQAEQLGARILEELDRPFSLDDAQVHIGASIGISFGLGCQSCDDLLREADQAMYRAKAAGRNCMHLGRRQDESESLDTPQ